MQSQTVPRRKEGWVKLSRFPGCMNNERFHIKARAQNHKGCGLSRIPAPRPPPHSLLLWQGWRKPPAPGRMEPTDGLWRGSGVEEKRGAPSYQHCPSFPTAISGCRQPGSPFFSPCQRQPGSGPGSSVIGGTVRLSPGLGCPAAPTADPLGQRTAFPHRTPPRVPEILKAEPSAPQRPPALHGRRWCSEGRGRRREQLQPRRRGEEERATDLGSCCPSGERQGQASYAPQLREGSRRTQPRRDEPQ